MSEGKDGVEKKRHLTALYCAIPRLCNRQAVGRENVEKIVSNCVVIMMSVYLCILYPRTHLSTHL